MRNSMSIAVKKWKRILIWAVVFCLVLAIPAYYWFYLARTVHAAFLGHGTHCKQFWRKYYCWEDPSYWFGESLEAPNIRGFDAVRRIFLIEIAKEWKRFVE